MACGSALQREAPVRRVTYINDPRHYCGPLLDLQDFSYKVGQDPYAYKIMVDINKFYIFKGERKRIS